MKLDFRSYIIAALLLVTGLYLYNTSLAFYIDDAGVYAFLSKRMVETNDFLNLYLDATDWLDKPHFPFWVGALFFKLFGVSSFAYLLPLVIATLLGLLYTFRFAQLYYNDETAWLSVFVLGTAQYVFMATTEGRIEPYLMLFIMASLFHFSKALRHNHLSDYIFASLFVALGVMTKGILIIIPIFGAIGGHILLKEKSLKPFFKWQWLLVLFFMFLFITPELYALYVQFDSQPEKIVFDRQGVSGIQWFLWDSQFTRFINAGPVTRSQGDYSFFLHTLIWAFSPWSRAMVEFSAVKGPKKEPKQWLSKGPERGQTRPRPTPRASISFPFHFFPNRRPKIYLLPFRVKVQACTIKAESAHTSACSEQHLHLTHERF
ncbi:MAG: glycosyltransferase family 39 protein, partial [Bacteroidota bacterium]